MSSFKIASFAKFVSSNKAPFIGTGIGFGLGAGLGAAQAPKTKYEKAHPVATRIKKGIESGLSGGLTGGLLGTAFWKPRLYKMKNGKFGTMGESWSESARDSSKTWGQAGQKTRDSYHQSSNQSHENFWKDFKSKYGFNADDFTSGFKSGRSSGGSHQRSSGGYSGYQHSYSSRGPNKASAFSPGDTEMGKALRDKLKNASTKQEAKSAFKEHAMKHHPDKPGGSAEKMRDLNAAWQHFTKPGGEFNKFAFLNMIQEWALIDEMEKMAGL